MDLIEAIAQVDRPLLGDSIPISVFRLFRQFSERNAADLIGDKGAKIVFVHAGRALGKNMGESMMSADLETYLANVTEYVKDASIGLLSMKTEGSKMVFRLDECITCAGMPSIGKMICDFEVGIVAGAVEAFMGRSVIAYESKCNANGDDWCEVTIDLEDQHVVDIDLNEDLDE